MLCAVLMGLVSLEFAVRACDLGNLFAYPNFVLTARTVLAERDGGRYVHDPALGHVPRAGYAAAGTTIEADGAEAQRRAGRGGRPSWRWAISSPTATRSMTGRPGRRSCSS